MHLRHGMFAYCRAQAFHLARRDKGIGRQAGLTYDKDDQRRLQFATLWWRFWKTEFTSPSSREIRRAPYYEEMTGLNKFAFGLSFFVMCCQCSAIKMQGSTWMHSPRNLFLRRWLSFEPVVSLVDQASFFEMKQLSLAILFPREMEANPDHTDSTCRQREYLFHFVADSESWSWLDQVMPLIKDLHTLVSNAIDLLLLSITPRQRPSQG